MRTWFSMSLLLALMACPKVSPETAVIEEATPGPDTPLPVDPNVRMGVLDNGMKWYIEVNKEPEQRAVFRMAVDAGSILEDEDQLGLAHFVEHMAFNGSENFESNDLIAYLESVGTRFGAHLNAHTSVDETVYKLQVPTDDPQILDQAFVVFQDWAGGLSFDDEEIEKERGVVLEEWRRGRGAGARIYDQIRPLNYNGSRYADRKTIGTEASLKTFELDAPKRFYRDWYRPDLMAIIVVGDIDPDAIQAKIEEHFSGLTGPESPRERIRPEVPDHDETYFAILTDPELTRTGVALSQQHDDPEVGTHGAYQQGLLESLVHRIVNERLRDIAQAPDAPFLGASSGSGKLTPSEGITRVAGSTPEGGELEGLRALATEIERVRRHGFTEPELKRAQEATLRSYRDYYDERDTTHSRIHADEMVRVFLTGESMPGIAYEWQIAQTFLPSVSVEQLNAHARDHWMLDHSRIVQITMPEKEGLVPPTEDAVRAVLAEVVDADIAPPEEEAALGPLLANAPEPGSIVDRRQVDALDASVWTLSNGIEVWLKSTDFRADYVGMRSHSIGGYGGLADDRYVPAATAIGLMNRSGLGDHDATQIRKQLAGKQASINAWIGQHHEGISGSASPEDLETMFELVHLVFTQPRFDTDAFDVDRRARAEGLRNRLSNPGAVYSDRFQALMWDGHPRHSPWTVETLDQMDLDASRAVFEDRFADASDFTFVLVGNLDLEAIEPLVTRYLASLPGGDRDDPWADDGARRATGVHKDVVRAGAEPKGRWTMEIHGDFEGSWLERNRLYALQDVLSVILRERLREDLGGVYGVSVRAGTWQLPEPGYRISIGFQCDPERVTELEEATLTALQDVIDNGVDAHYVEDLKEKNRRSRETDLRSNGFWLGGIDGTLRRGEDPLELMTWDERNNSLDADAIHEAARTWLDLTQYVNLTLLPAQGE